MRDVLLEVMEDKGVGRTSLKVERLCALLDPRWKSLGGDQLVNGSAALEVRAEVDLNALEFEDARTQPPAPVPAPVANVAPAEPAPKRKKPSRRGTARGTGSGSRWYYWQRWGRASGFRLSLIHI